MKYTHQYLVRVQYLGFRYSGWQKQPQHKTVEGMLYKTLKFVLADTEFKIIGAGRTDAKVSALSAAFELFIADDCIESNPHFIELFNKNLPPDIRITDLKPVSKAFNIIQDVENKTYCYLFSFGEKNHPFAAASMANFITDLDIDLMIEAAGLFKGTHDFSNFTVRKGQETKNCVRTIDHCSIRVNSEYTASFYPNTSYLLEVRGKGFLRYQIRLIMGALYQIGTKELSKEELLEILDGTKEFSLKFVAPGSGLFLKELNFN
jgi:tRNA pseudouridine38-40 synthase